MDIISAIASFIAIGQAIAVTPKIIQTFKSFRNASKGLESVIDELDEFPYLQLVRKSIESMIAELQRLADLCLIEEDGGSKASKIQWWKKKRDITKLRDECHKQREQLGALYMLLRDQYMHKQSQLLFQIYTRVFQDNEDPPDELRNLPLPDEQHHAMPPSLIKEGLYKTPRRYRRDLHFRLLDNGFISYQSQTAAEGQCSMSCCTVAQSFVALQFRIPTWSCRLAITGTFKFGLAFGISASLTPITKYPSRNSETHLRRVCFERDPASLNQWLFYYAGSIVSVDDNIGDSVLEDIMAYGAFPLLTHCTMTWPGLVKGTTAGRSVATRAKIVLITGRYGFLGSPRKELCADDRIHLARFIEFMEEDEGDDVLDIIRSEDRVGKLDQTLSTTSDVLTKRSLNGNTLLHFACLLDDAELVRELIVRGTSLSTTNNDNFAPLHIACINFCWPSAEILLKAGCPVNMRGLRDTNPLMLAAAQVHKNPSRAIHFVKTLLSRGASIGPQSSNGNTIWHTIRLTSSRSADLWELYEMLFEVGGARLINNMDRQGVTPLVESLLFGNGPLIPFLKHVGARCDVGRDGWNLLHFMSTLGTTEACQMAEELEINDVDIRTTDSLELTPLLYFRARVHNYHEAMRNQTGFLKVTNWDDPYQDRPGENQVSEKAAALEHLLRSIRDRMLLQEIQKLELIISKLRIPDRKSARDELQCVVQAKVKAKINHEAQTFQAIELDVREGRLELAIDSIRDFIATSRDRMCVSPFDEESNPWEPSRVSPMSPMDPPRDDASIVEVELNDDGDTSQSSSEHGALSDAEDYEDDGWKTADENWHGRIVPDL
ncbi:hypothetical protein GGR51DRAFT_563688 [Nemania sp. FL0031]|nr:hypothetical protein GGR51DRAFT_563688 [Nemania sp. FL0031]